MRVFAFLVFVVSFSAIADDKIAFLLSRYSDSKQTCTILRTDTVLHVVGETYFKDILVASRTLDIQDTTGFSERAARLLSSTYEDAGSGPADALYMISAFGKVNGEEVETPIFATGERNLESTSPEAIDFFYDVNFYCKDVLVSAFN